MQTVPVSLLASRPQFRQRTAIVASADLSFRRRLSHILSGLRWQVREAEGGAQAWAEAEARAPEALVVDAWLPDLDLNEFLDEFRGRFPQVDLVSASGTGSDGPRGPWRQELLLALRQCQDSDTAAWNAAPPALDPSAASSSPSRIDVLPALPAPSSIPAVAQHSEQVAAERLPELIGNAHTMLEVSRRVRLVAPRMTPVLIEGPTGSGKELVAEALHRLSPRSRKPFIAINCAAIPGELLEAELFGHTRGAFTGAVQGRTGRIEAADGGTLFLDEIGEMPLGLQAKLLRFVECGELQRVGENETARVDVRIVAATHRRLAEQTARADFRSDLYYRLAVFLIRTPPLVSHLEDLPLLVNHFLERLGRNNPVKRADAGAMAKLKGHPWPGNVRELEHVLERAAILASDSPVLTAAEIDFGLEEN